MSYLNSIPGVSIAGEILHPDQMEGLPRGMSKTAVIRHIRRSLNRCGSELCGVKLPSIHLQSHGLDIRQLHEHFPTSKVILLYRRSIADQYLSFQVARATKRWRFKNGQETVQPSQKIVLDRNEFLRYVRQVKDFYSGTLAMEGVRSYALILSYEELVADGQETFNRKVFPFLGLKPSPVAADDKKGLTRPPSEIIEDFESVRDFWEQPGFIQSYQ